MSDGEEEEEEEVDGVVVRLTGQFQEVLWHPGLFSVSVVLFF